jgi:hypothetical protein
MNLANESYFMIIEKLKFDRDNFVSNYLINKHIDNILIFENNINSKRRVKGKKLINDIELMSNPNSKKLKKFK